ncbi:hypothetical protein CEXT_490151 [Caerostris extrusa]|uniref:Uncharacterized protein n=1 Tax=Caerostris extrusa TaxID=172846 RepID=A0AAV4WZH7_CAEEX|nr:hypothetical protein CEXT_490151 [Caerostris extrusa]
MYLLQIIYVLQYDRFSPSLPFLRQVNHEKYPIPLPAPATVTTFGAKLPLTSMARNSFLWDVFMVDLAKNGPRCLHTPGVPKTRFRIRIRSRRVLFDRSRRYRFFSGVE